MSDRVRLVVIDECDTVVDRNMFRCNIICTGVFNHVGQSAFYGATHLLVPVELFSLWECQGHPGWGLRELKNCHCLEDDPNICPGLNEWDCPDCNGRGWALEADDE